MSFNVTIRNVGKPIKVEMGDTILASALAQGLAYPFGCESGNCGACKSTLFGGDVEMSPYSEFALSDGEKAQGLILACRAVPWSDCDVAWLEADEVAIHASRVLDCTVTAVDAMTHDIKRLRLNVERGGPYDFSAGQYARVTFPGLPPRDYSMANRPDEATLEFHIRLLPGGAVTPFVANSLKAGDRVKVEGPFGTAYFREKHTGPIIAAAGGSGLAPIKAIVETALAKGAAQPISLYFGVRDERDLYMEAEFRALEAKHKNLKFIPVLSERSGATARRTGYVADAIAADIENLDGYKAYLAGPPIMVETATRALEASGLLRQDIHADAFYTEADKAKLEKAS